MPNNTIFLIDDEQICIDSVKMILDATNYHLISAANARNALSVLSENYAVIDLILLDLMMIDCHGLELLSEIKKNSLYNHIPVIIQTGSNNERDILSALTMGAVSCIYKPYKKSALIAAIDNVFNNAKEYN